MFLFNLPGLAFFSFLLIFYNLIFHIIYKKNYKNFFLIILAVIILLNIYFFQKPYTTIYINNTITYTFNLNFIFNYYTYIFPIFFSFIFITTISFYTCLAFNKNEINTFITYLFILLISGLCLFLTNSLFLFFIFYEILLIPSFLLLYKYAKTRKAIEAAYLMFFWTQFGAFFFILLIFFFSFFYNTTTFTNLNLISLTIFEQNFILLLLLLTFGVKWPIWPFYGWLPKAHVEASTNFSIFLSGVLVKFAFLGFLKFYLYLSFDTSFTFLFSWLLVGLFDSVWKLFYQLDLKKIIAYATVFEMHWLALATLTGYTPLMFSALIMYFNHALLSTNAFLLVDNIMRRYKTRLTSELMGLFFMTPNLYLLLLTNTLLFLGFPGSLSFITELFFFLFIWDLSPLLFFFLIIFIYFLVAFFFFSAFVEDFY